MTIQPVRRTGPGVAWPHFRCSGVSAEAARRFRLLIADGVESGESRPLTDEVVDELRGRALGPEE